MAERQARQTAVRHAVPPSWVHRQMGASERLSPQASPGESAILSGISLLRRPGRICKRPLPYPVSKAPICAAMAV